MVYTLNGVTLNNVQKLSSTKDSQLFHMPMPGSDSNQAFALDIMGASRIISISGYQIGTEIEAATFISGFDAGIDGAQTAVDFVCGISGATYKVYIQSLTWEYSAGEPGTINYQITLMECSG